MNVMRWFKRDKTKYVKEGTVIELGLTSGGNLDEILAKTTKEILKQVEHGDLFVVSSMENYKKEINTKIAETIRGCHAEQFLSRVTELERSVERLKLEGADNLRKQLDISRAETLALRQINDGWMKSNNEMSGRLRDAEKRLKESAQESATILNKTGLIPYNSIKDKLKKHPKLYDLDLTPHTLTILNKEGITTVKDLLKYTREDLSLIYHVGQRRLDEIIDALRVYNLYLKDE